MANHESFQAPLVGFDVSSRVVEEPTEPFQTYKPLGRDTERDDRNMPGRRDSRTILSADPDFLERFRRASKPLDQKP